MGYSPNTTHKVMEVSKVMGGTPKSSIYRWMLHEINHPAIEVPPLMELPGENDDKPLEFRSTHAFSPRSTLTRHRPSMKSGPAAGFWSQRSGCRWDSITLRVGWEFLPLSMGMNGGFKYLNMQNWDVCLRRRAYFGGWVVTLPADGKDSLCLI